MPKMMTTASFDDIRIKNPIEIQMKKCDCLNHCGDDPGINAKTVQPCETYRKYLEAQARLNKLMAHYHVGTFNELIEAMQNRIEKFEAEG